MPRCHVLPALLLLSWGSGSCLANDNCESIRTQIEAKVRASGAKDYAVTVVGADAKAAGQVVGSCDLGAKRIVYTRSSSPAPAPQPKTTTRDEDVITECKDGTVVRGGGDCHSASGSR